MLVKRGYFFFENTINSNFKQYFSSPKLPPIEDRSFLFVTIFQNLTYDFSLNLWRRKLEKIQNSAKNRALRNLQKYLRNIWIFVAYTSVFPVFHLPHDDKNNFGKKKNEPGIVKIETVTLWNELRWIVVRLFFSSCLSVDNFWKIEHLVSEYSWDVCTRKVISRDE